MRFIWTATLVAWPMGASAGLVFIDYSGTVDVVRQIGGEGCGCIEPPVQYRVGDVISGRLTLDLDLAPANSSIFTQRYGVYGDSPSPSADFVRGFNPPSEQSNDSVYVRNAASLDVYRITDWWSADASTYSGLSLTASLTADLVPNTDIVPRLLLTPETAPPGTFTGFITWAKDGVRQNVNFVLDRFEVTPGRCTI